MRERVGLGGGCCGGCGCEGAEVVEMVMEMARDGCWRELS